MVCCRKKTVLRGDDFVLAGPVEEDPDEIYSGRKQQQVDIKIVLSLAGSVRTLEMLKIPSPMVLLMIMGVRPVNPNLVCCCSMFLLRTELTENYFRILTRVLSRIFRAFRLFGFYRLLS